MALLLKVTSMALQHMPTQREAFSRVSVCDWGLGYRKQTQGTSQKIELPPRLCESVSWISQILNFTENFLCYFTLQLHPEQEHVSDKHYSCRLDLTVLYMHFMLMGTCHELMAVLTAPQGYTSEITTSFGYSRRPWTLQIWSLFCQKRRQDSHAKNLGLLS